VRNSIGDDKIKAKLADADKTKIEKAVEDGLAWLEAHGDAEKEEFEEKQKEVEKIIMPLMAKV
jgi:heat shock 70kDa protein 1/2/6/8